MDKIYHFKGKSIAQGHLKQFSGNQAGFYSEEETEDTQSPAKFTEAKKSSFQNSSSLGVDDNFLKSSKLRAGIPQAQAEKEQSDVEEFSVRQHSQTVGYSKPTHSHSNSLLSKVDMKNKLLNGNNNLQQISNIDSDGKITKKIDTFDGLATHPFRHLIFSGATNEANFKKHLTLTYRGLVYARKCLKGPSEKFVKSKQVNVPESRNPKGKTLLLDLDETLIHSCGLKENPEHIIKAKADIDDKVGYQIGLRVRPFCMEFLQKLSNYWDIYVYTASSPTYASAIVRFLDPEGKLILGILNRSNCMETKNGFFIKDLRILKGKDLKKMVLVDNLAHSFGFQIENGIPILEWHQDKADQELKYLINYLIEAANADDVRIFNREKLRLIELSDSKVEDI